MSDTPPLIGGSESPALLDGSCGDGLRMVGLFYRGRAASPSPPLPGARLPLPAARYDGEMSEQPKPNPEGRRVSYLWFVAGFLLAFVAFAVWYPMLVYDGHALYRAALWQYYLQAMRSSGNLGPASGNTGSVLVTAIIHVAASAVAGAIVASIGGAWTSRRRA